MSNAFVWFQNNSSAPADTTKFYEQVLGWKASDGPGGSTMFMGESAPISGLNVANGTVLGWVPYAEVSDVDAATQKAKKAGGVVVQDKTRGPAGEFSIVRDPGGATLALWQKA